jgi:hypothetical protein
MAGPWMAAYVVAAAEDGYRVVFSLAELDASVRDSEALVADTVDGTPLPDGEGPFRLIVPSDKRASRWVRMLRSVTISRIAN